MPTDTSMQGKTVLITGATDGLGREVAREVAARGARVVLHGRSRERAEDTMAGIRDATGNDRLSYHLADLAELAQVRRLAREVSDTQDRLDVVVNNAGVIEGERQLSADGHEMTLAVNYLAPFVLTRELLALLRASAPSLVVNVASVGQSPVDFEDPMLESGWSPMRAYSQSKLALIMATFDLAEELEGTGVAATCLHPATFMPTKMVHQHVGRTLDTLEEGTESTLALIAGPDPASLNGRFFDHRRESRANEQAYDPGARKSLRQLSEALTAP